MPRLSLHYGTGIMAPRNLGSIFSLGISALVHLALLGLFIPSSGLIEPWSASPLKSPPILSVRLTAQPHRILPSAPGFASPKRRLPKEVVLASKNKHGSAAHGVHSSSPMNHAAGDQSLGSESPGIDVDAAFKLTRQIAKTHRQAAQTPAHESLRFEQEAALSRSIEKSARPDCRSARSGLGLLAIPALLADSLGDSGCRW